MKRYDTQDLSNPQTYQDDPELEKICRQTINSAFRELGYESRAEAREAVFGGKHPEWVKSLVDQLVCNQVATDKQTAQNIKTVNGLVPPDGLTLEVCGDEILIHGPYNKDLHNRLKRKGGYWDGKNYGNRKCLVVPLEAAGSLKRIFTNSRKAGAKTNEKQRIAELDRWLEYVEEKADQGWIYEKGVAKLHELEIDKYPEHAARLRKLIERTHQIKRESDAESSFGQSWNARKTDYCPQCEKAIHIGDDVHYRYQNGKRLHVEHVDCETAKADHDRRQAEEKQQRAAAPYRIAAGSGHGGFEYHVGQIVRRGNRKDQQDWPEFLYVVRCEKQYYHEDGLSFGVGDDSGYIYTADCRAATTEEAAPLKAKIKARNHKRQLLTDLEKLKKQIRDTGEFPQGTNHPEGEIYFDTQDIYGGGDWFVVGPDWIWYVRNNGADGDNWAANNIWTGGAGAVGWRLPYSDELAEKFEFLKTELKGAVEQDAQDRRLAAMIADDRAGRTPNY